MELDKIKRVMSSVLGELPLKADTATFKPSGSKRETQEGEVCENTGFVESAVSAELSMTLQAFMDASEFAKIKNDTLQIFLSRGGVHMMPNAWVTDQVELGKGELKVVYKSGTSQKIQ